MNWAIPRAPAGETARGSKPDSASSCAASSDGRDVPAGGGPGQRRAVAAGHERGHRPGLRAVGAGATRRRRGRAGSGAAGEAEVPGLPGVALDEAEPPGVRRQPPVGGGRAEVELGRTAMQRGAGRRDPARVRVLGEETRLLGVGAIGRGDHQGDAGPAARRPPSGRTRRRHPGASACPGDRRAAPRTRPRTRSPAGRRPVVAPPAPRRETTSLAGRRGSGPAAPGRARAPPRRRRGTAPRRGRG